MQVKSSSMSEQDIPGRGSPQLPSSMLFPWTAISLDRFRTLARLVQETRWTWKNEYLLIQAAKGNFRIEQTM